ncbi:MAG: hypothetical protein Q8P31_04080 [Bacillota bacterium]|nr:hypothetical protein [Bacillota bacterium]
MARFWPAVRPSPGTGAGPVGRRALCLSLVLAVGLMPLAGVAVSGCRRSGGDVGPGWVSHQDPAGYALQCPEGWRVGQGARGGFTCRSPAGDAEALFWGAVLKEGFALDEPGLRQVLGAALGPHEVQSVRQVGSSGGWVARAVVRHESGDWPGVYVSAVDGRNLMLSGFSATPAAQAQHLPVLLGVLASFSFTADPAGIAALAGATGFETFRDPHEGAFSLLVPKGWTVTGGLDRPYIDAALRLELTDGQAYIHVASPYPPLFVTPSFILTQLGLREGSAYSPWGHFFNPYGKAWDMQVRSYRDAAAYIREIFAPYLAQVLPGTALVSVQARPDVAEAIPRPSGVVACTSALAEFTGPDGIRQGCTVTDQLMSAGGIGLWGVSLVYWRAPESKAQGVRQLISVMEQSFRVDTGWAGREAAQVNQRLGIISRTGDEIAATVDAVYRYRAAVEDRAARRFSEAVLGLEYVFDPGTGRAWQVPNYSGYYWRRGSEIYRTAGPTPPSPDPEFVELFRGG